MKLFTDEKGVFAVHPPPLTKLKCQINQLWSGKTEGIVREHAYGLTFELWKNWLFAELWKIYSSLIFKDTQQITSIFMCDRKLINIVSIL